MLTLEVLDVFTGEDFNDLAVSELEVAVVVTG